ncbi:oligopeptide permease-like protein (plasmid) [Borrelia miyamotoi]|uniref:Oligopeptide permease-like protein n=1 Tax=Borrelia miyamotoi TaxID=47466 RepID=A0AAX3JPL8_9SPIR|nr:oligopeptide permease-like protein [Borrelia miyamotoi]QFP42393.1 oligopeptide permease-like protein [Borrelia miyamotoi]QFP48513.1 oligopeptide permease-like protein [Borrelia miyamotoi]WAZ72639.1 oligopeptide permease-like protein [Borrelia miyamotoi]
MLSFFKNLKLIKILLFFLLAACSSLQQVEHDTIIKKIRIYQHLSKNLELKGVVDYQNKTTEIFLYSKLRNHSIINQTPLTLPDGTKIEGKTSYECDNNASTRNWINSSSFSLKKAMLEQMLNEDEYVYNKEEVKVQIGLETLKINKTKIRDFLLKLESTEKQHIQNTNKGEH